MPIATVLPGPLAGLRILELANETGQFCGKLLGDLEPMWSRSNPLARA